MKKTIAYLLTGFILLFLPISCMQQPLHFDSHPDPSMDMTVPVLIFSAVFIAGITTAVLLARHSHVKLSPAGENVKLIMHEEAPEEAEFLGDIQSKTLADLTSVKNDLRNQAALLGGNLLVIDTIQPEIYNGENYGYLGSGRVYSWY